MIRSFGKNPVVKRLERFYFVILLLGSVIGFLQSMFAIHVIPEIWVFMVTAVIFGMIFIHFAIRIFHSPENMSILIFGWSSVLLFFLVERQVLPGILFYLILSVLILTFGRIGLFQTNSYLENLWLTRQHHYKEFYNSILFIKKDDISLLRYYPFSPESVIAEELIHHQAFGMNKKWFWILIQIPVMAIFVVFNIVIHRYYILGLLPIQMIWITIFYFYLKK